MPPLYLDPIMPMPVPEIKLLAISIWVKLIDYPFMTFQFKHFSSPKIIKFSISLSNSFKMHSKHIWLGSVLGQKVNIEPKVWARTLIFCKVLWIVCISNFSLITQFAGCVTFDLLQSWRLKASDENLAHKTLVSPISLISVSAQKAGPHWA